MYKGNEDMYLYETEEKKTIVVVCYAPNLDTAKIQANKYFKVSHAELTGKRGYVNEQGLWWTNEEDCVPCFAVWRKK